MTAAELLKTIIGSAVMGAVFAIVLALTQEAIAAVKNRRRDE